MKKFFKTFIILFILLGVSFNLCSTSRAEDELTNIDIPPEISEMTIPKETVSKNVFIFTQDDVNIDYNIEGDLFVCCAGTLTINSSISGNAFICTPKTEILENASIGGSIFSATKDLDLSGSIKNNIYSACNNFTSNKSRIGLDVFLVAQNINFNSIVNGDANIAGESINFSNESRINGNLNYSSEEEINISENIVAGNITYNQPEENPVKISIDKYEPIKDWIKSTLTFLVLVLALFYIGKYIMPNFINKQNISKQNILKCLLYGLLGLITIPVVSVLLFVLGITSSLGLLLILSYIILLVISSSFVLISIANLLKSKYGDKISANDIVKDILSISIVVILYKLLKLIPTIGGLITFIVILIGLGICINSLIHKKETN